MNTNRNTEELLQHMRNKPVEVPLEKVEQFVLAQAALGITAVGASKGIFTKAFLKLHLNSILIMTSTIAASIVGVFFWATHTDKTAAVKNSNAKPEFEYTSTFIPKIDQEADTPKTVTTKTIKDGEEISVTTVETGTGTNIKIVTTGNSETAVYYNTTNDSNYVFAFANADKAAIPPVPPTPAMTFKYNKMLVQPLMPLGCCANDSLVSILHQVDPMPALMQMEPMPPMPLCNFKSCNDSLMTGIEKSLLKDGLITDTLHYSFKINGSYMKVNGEKMSKEQWKKYKEIIESNSKNKVNRSFSYAISKDGDDVQINVENFVD
jgi:hypothetical protein